MTSIVHTFQVLYVYKNLLRGLNFQVLASKYNPYSLGHINVVFSSRLLKLDNLNTFKVLGMFFILALLTNQKPSVARVNTLSSFRNKSSLSRVEFVINVGMPRSLVIIERFWLTFVCNLSLLDLDREYRSRANIYQFILKDVSLLKGVETHSVFFKWREWVVVTLNVKGLKSLEIFLKVLKLL